MPTYIIFEKQGIEYTLPTTHTGIRSDGVAIFGSAVENWWTYHFTYEEWSDIITTGTLKYAGIQCKNAQECAKVINGLGVDAFGEELLMSMAIKHNYVVNLRLWLSL